MILQKKVVLLVLSTIISVFCLLQGSFADMIAPRFPSHSIDFTPRYVFIATEYGVNVYDKRSQKWEAIPLKIQERNTILETEEPFHYYRRNDILTVRVHNDKVWFGSYERGAYRYDLTTGKLRHYEGYYGVYDDKTRRDETRGNCELLDNVVNSIVIDRKGNVWFATNSGVSKLMDKSWKNYRSSSCDYAPTLQDKEVIFGGNITCMEVDQDGHIWLGRSDFHYTYYDAYPPETVVDGGISVFDGERWTHYYAKIYDLEHPDEFHVKTELISNDVECLTIDNKEIWIGTPKGVSVYNKMTKEWRSYTTDNSGIISNNIASIAVGEDAIWIATDSGISRYHKADNRWTNYGSDVLPSIHIRSIGYDVYDKSIWIVTHSYCETDIYAYRFDGSNWTVFPTRRRFCPQNVEELLKLGTFLKGRLVKEEAKAVFTEVCKKYPTSNESIQAEYEILTMEKDLNALKKFKKRHPHPPYAPNVQLEIARCYENQGDYRQAIKEYRKFLKETQDLQEAYNAKWSIAECHRRLKDYQKEIEACRDLYDSFHGVNESFRQITQGIPWRIAGIYMDQLKDYRKAIEWFEMYLQKRKGGGSPDEVILKIGTCYENLGEDEEAIQVYKRIKEGSWKFKEAERRIIKIENRLGIIKEYPIKSIYLDKFDENLIWFRTEGGGVWRYEKDTGRSFNFTTKNGLSSNIIEDILVTKRDIWVKTEEGIDKINKATNKTKLFGRIVDIAYDGQNVWMINAHKKTAIIVKYNEIGDTMEEVTPDDPIRFPVGYKIIQDGEYVWTYGGEYLAGYNKTKNTWDKYGKAEYLLRFKASDGSFLWFDTDDVFGGSVGIYRFDKRDQSWELFPRVSASEVLPTERYVWFIGTRDVVRYDKVLNEFKNFSLSRYPRKFLLVGGALYGIFNEGAFRLDEVVGDWKESYPAPRHFSRGDFRFLTVQDGSIWFVYVEYSHDLYRFDTITKSWEKFALPLSNIKDLTIDKECAWIISVGEVFKYDFATKGVEKIPLTTSSNSNQKKR